METAIKTALAKKNSEMEKLEKTEKSYLRMISSSGARLKLKYGRSEDCSRVPGKTDSRNIRMYETHNPGFCYLRNGEYRQKISNQLASSCPDPVQCSEKVKEILFTDSELDIYKTMCLHLLGTHIQSKSHIQRKDGRLCSYVKSQTVGTTPQTLQPITQRIGNHANDSPTKYDKMLPRYILDVKILQKGISNPSFKTADMDSASDEELRKKRKLQVPIYINNEIRMIINSVMEALEAVESYKLNALIDLASSPEELRNMLADEDLQEFIIELAGNPLVMKPTSYDYIMAHLMFDKIPEKGTLETVAQVLEVHNDAELRNSLNQIRKAILQRHLELMNSNILPRKKLGIQDKSSQMDNHGKISNQSVTYNLKCSTDPRAVEADTKPFKKPSPVNKDSITEKENENKVNKKRKNVMAKSDTRSLNITFEKASTDDEYNTEQEENSSNDSNCTQNQCNKIESNESTRWDLHNLSNSQRILLGLKVASLKCKPINMHQFDGKKKVDIGAIISPIIRPHVTDVDYKQNSPENLLQNFSLPERRVKKSTNKVSQTTDLENLTRAHLANLRLEISGTENKKRVNQFISTIP